MKYYVPEHDEGYRRIRSEGKTSWGQLHGEATFEDSEIRDVLREVLPRITFATSTPRALEYGCGTGPGACLLAESGVAATGFDLSPIAIEIARREAAARKLRVEYSVADVLNPPPLHEAFDLIVDSYCLQCIVTDADRQRLFSFVRQSLCPRGWYLIATAGFSPMRDYGESLFDPATGIEMEQLREPPERFEDAVRVNGRWYLPSRRHITLDALSRELAESGFTIEWGRTASDGDLAVLARLA